MQPVITPCRYDFPQLDIEKMFERFCEIKFQVIGILIGPECWQNDKCKIIDNRHIASGPGTQTSATSKPWILEKT